MSTSAAEPADSPASPGFRSTALGFIGWLLTRLIGMTLRIRYEGSERIDNLTAKGGAILVTWHGRSLVAANVFRKRGYWALISFSRDGEIQNQIFRRYGFQTIRGSSSKGGVRALIQLTRRLKEGESAAFTPDGPRGPTHKVQGGVIHMAQRTGCPIIPFCASARPRRLLRSWDSYLIPMPFARATFVVGEPIYLPAEMSDDQQMEAAERVEQAINSCETRAEELLGFTQGHVHP